MRHCRWLTAILALSMAGCVLRGKHQAKLPAVPPPAPQPAGRPQGGGPAARPEPLSIPQTQAQLPPAQPIDPQALATAQPPSQPVEAQPPSRTRPRPTVHGPTPSRPDAAPATTTAVPAAPAATPAAAPQPPPPAEEVREQVQEILAPEELKRLQDLVANQKQEVHRVIDPTAGRKLTSQQTAAVSRIHSFLKELEEAEKRSDWRQANLLGERALILAREFQGGVR